MEQDVIWKEMTALLMHLDKKLSSIETERRLLLKSNNDNWEGTISKRRWGEKCPEAG